MARLFPLTSSRRAGSHEEAGPSRTDEIIATVTSRQSRLVRRLPASLAASVGLLRRAEWARERGRKKREAGTRPANHKHTASRTKRAARVRLRGPTAPGGGGRRTVTGVVSRGVAHLRGARASKWKAHERNNSDAADRRAQLTLAPLLRISAASSYSGFIFLQWPHP